MKVDYITYKQAANNCVGGIVLQSLIAAALLIYGTISHDHAAVTQSIFAAVGALAWIALAVVYDQHRRERIEAIEADAMATSSLAGTSVFSESAEEFRPAAKRLAGLHKYFVPTVSILISVVLVGAGIWRFMVAKTMVSADQFSPPRHEGWALGVGLAIAGLGFMFARYAAGLAKHGPWANLRAGASFAIGSALMGLGMAVVNMIDLIGPDTGVRYYQVIAPIFVVLAGAETMVHFILGIYRPRRPGEIPRPAFDSRLLGLLAAPDQIAQSISEAVNYQLGFDVSSGWFYKLLSRALVPLFFFGLLVVWVLSAVAVIRPHQRGLILRFGKVINDNVEPGVHFKLPWPIDEVYIPEYYSRGWNGTKMVSDYTVTGLRTIELGTAPPATKDPILWTNDHAGEEIFQLVRTSAALISANSTGDQADLSDLSVLSAELPLQYIVSDVLLYDQLGPANQRDDILRATAQHELVSFFQGVTVDDVLGGKRLDLSAKMRERVQAAFDKLNPGPDGKPRGAGVSVLRLAIVGAHPPKNVAPAFETPVQADQKREANIQAAEADGVKSLTEVAGDVATARKIIASLNELEKMRDRKADAKEIRDQEFAVQKLLESAGGSAAASLSRAQAERWSRHMTIRGIAARQQGRVELFNAAPEVFKARTYFATLASIMKDARVYIAPEKSLIIDYDLKDKDFGQDIFKNNTIGQGSN